jgi:hypothetical protein
MPKKFKKSNGKGFGRNYSNPSPSPPQKITADFLDVDFLDRVFKPDASESDLKAFADSLRKSGVLPAGCPDSLIFETLRYTSQFNDADIAKIFLAGGEP